MRFLPDRRLYYRTQECLEWLRSTEFEGSAALTGERERCHMYWRGPFGVKQTFAVMSFLATQDLEQTELWLWLDAESGYDEHEASPLLRPLLPHVHVRRFDPEAEVKGTPAEGHPELYEVNPTKRSDLLRCVVCHKYGGIYIDIDAMLLRDFRELPPDEFVYRWGTRHRYGNSAFMRLREGSEAGEWILERAAKKRSCHPYTLFHFDHCARLDVLMLPCVFFDPLWPHEEERDVYAAAPFDHFRGFFRRFGPQGFPRQPQVRTYRDFFRGAFAYHWHNFWRVPEPADSYFGVFYQEFEAILDERLGIVWSFDDLELVEA